MNLQPGKKTSELLLSALVVAIIVFSEKAGIFLTAEQVTSLTIIAVSYTGGRSLIKVLLPFLTGMVKDKVSNVVNTTVNPVDPADTDDSPEPKK